MPDFGFVGPSYVAPSIYVNGEECINFRPEVDITKQAGQRGVVALYPTPGLTAILKLDTGEVRGMRTVSGGEYCVAVCRSDVYIIDSTFTATHVGQLNTSTGVVGITDNGNNVYIVDGSNRYTWRISNPSSAQYIASISGTTLTVTLMKSGTIAVNQEIFADGISLGTVITALGTGTGGVGTYTVNTSQTVTSKEFNSSTVGAVYTGSIAGNILTVTAISSGVIYPGQTVQCAGVASGTIIQALGGGTVLSYVVASGGTGYALNDTITVQGGVYGTSPAVYTVSAISGSAVTGLTLVDSGNYTSIPSNPVSTSTTGSGSGLTLTLTFGTGTGGTGTYVLSNSQTLTSRTMYGLNFTTLPSSDGAFEGANVVDIVDNYFVYNRPSTQQWASSNLLSPITNPLSFASKFTSPDDLVSIIVDHGQVYLLGESTSEVWADVGTYPFPFQRIPGSSSQHGIAAKFSMARVGNSFAYVSRNIRGQAQIMVMNGYFPERISTHAVENTLVNVDVSNAVAWTYQQEGHECYVVTFPNIDLTWVYDVSTQMWHKWLYCDNTNQYHRHRGNCMANFQNRVLIGDWENGLVYQLDPENYTDNGQYTRRLRRAVHAVTDYQRQYFEELQIYFQPGVGLNTGVGQDPQAMLRWSNDGGSTWSNEHWVSIGKMGKYANRAIWRRLGWARDRVFEVVVSDPIKAVIVSANLKATLGEN